MPIIIRGLKMGEEKTLTGQLTIPLTHLFIPPFLTFGFVPITLKC